MAEKKLRWGAANLPVDFRKDDETFRQTSRTGRLRTGPEARGRRSRRHLARPASDTLTYRQHFDLVSKRLRAVAECCPARAGLGLEYVGPKTAWSGRRYPFLHTLAETRELIDAIGGRGVGVVLDSWHWFLAGDTAADIADPAQRGRGGGGPERRPAGVPKDQQVDNAASCRSPPA